jgi:hypothetical protein
MITTGVVSLKILIKIFISLIYIPVLFLILSTDFCLFIYHLLRSLLDLLLKRSLKLSQKIHVLYYKIKAFQLITELPEKIKIMSFQ